MTGTKYFTGLIKTLKNIFSKKNNSKELEKHKIDIRKYDKPYQWPKKNIKPKPQSKTPLNQHSWKEE